MADTTQDQAMQQLTDILHKANVGVDALGPLMQRQIKAEIATNSFNLLGAVVAISLIALLVWWEIKVYRERDSRERDSLNDNILAILGYACGGLGSLLGLIVAIITIDESIENLIQLSINPTWAVMQELLRAVR